MPVETVSPKIRREIEEILGKKEFDDYFNTPAAQEVTGILSPSIVDPYKLRAEGNKPLDMRRFYPITNEYKTKVESHPLDESVPYELGKYPYKPTLDVFITEQYTAEGAWAHTEPDRNVVCIRPHGCLGYELFAEHPWAMNIPFGIVLVHEVGHNEYPGASEGVVRSFAQNPDARHILPGFNLKYHGRN